MSKSVDKFNELFTEFIDKIITKFPNQKLYSYRRAFVLVKLTSPSSPANFFMAGCIDYKNEIKERNDLFFINDSSIKSKINNFSIEIGIAEYWNDLTDSTKTAVWDYIQSLFVLGEVIISQNNTEFARIRNSNIENYSNDISNFPDQQFSTEFLLKLNS